MRSGSWDGIPFEGTFITRRACYRAGMGRVCIGTCSGLADAAFLRSVFAAHDIPVLINAENHASMLGGLGGAFVRLDIVVDEAYAEDAAALLLDARGRA